jgi:hypothetical protein
LGVLFLQHFNTPASPVERYKMGQKYLTVFLNEITNEKIGTIFSNTQIHSL